MIAADFISESITFARSNYSGEQVLTLMNVFQVKHLPVVDEQYGLIGLISDDDVLIRNYSENIDTYHIDYQKIYVLPDQHIFDIIHLLSKNDISLVPVVDEHNKYLGSIRKQDVISFLGNSFSFSYPGSIIELIIQNRNFSLVEISRIVEAENAKIISLFIAESGEDIAQLKVILKINKQDISHIIAAFERFEYEINASFTEVNEYDDFLKERYDSLLRYLNV